MINQASTAVAKRTFDILGAGIGLALTLPLFPLIALAIKIESPGPVFFRQMRIGAALEDRTVLFEMIKFRSMRQDAEARSGAVWAQKNDPRVTRVGKFIRKTRLDELPQFLNVLKGDMALIGPRPERPGFYQKLETAIPYFAERTAGVKPGITGLAQVRQGYDETIEDVRSKVAFDHAYAIHTQRFFDWLAMDIGIVFRTVAIMAFGRGR
ncbi:MAG: sugar transferase [Boseongicola sp.]|nr:sugar transferase [Boseongicola sp.]